MTDQPSTFAQRLVAAQPDGLAARLARDALATRVRVALIEAGFLVHRPGNRDIEKRGITVFLVGNTVGIRVNVGINPESRKAAADAVEIVLHLTFGENREINRLGTEHIEVRV